MHTGKSVGETIAAIHMLEQNMRAGGAVDSEPTQLHEIIRKLNSGEITAEHAMMLAHQIEGGRQNYH